MHCIMISFIVFSEVLVEDYCGLLYLKPFGCSSMYKRILNFFDIMAYVLVTF